jgi:hypothetical protein
MLSKPTCKTRLKKNVVNKRTFDREMELCRILSAENKGGCGWGKCASCGVIPLLVKLHKGELLMEEKEIADSRKKYLRK